MLICPICGKAAGMDGCRVLGILGERGAIEEGELYVLARELHRYCAWFSLELGQGSTLPSA